MDEHRQNATITRGQNNSWSPPEAIEDLNHLMSSLRSLYDFYDDDQRHSLNSELTKNVMQLFSLYKSNERDWSRFSFYDPQQLTRHLLENYKGKYNLMIVYWYEGQASKIHDHPTDRCVMKVIRVDKL